MYATQYRESYPYYQHEKIGYNYRMSNICAGIGRGQMTVVEEHLKHHKHVQKMYEELLKGVHMLPGYTHNIINLSETEDLVTVMYCNEVFDPGRPDTFFEKV